MGVEWALGSIVVLEPWLVEGVEWVEVFERVEVFVQVLVEVVG